MQLTMNRGGATFFGNLEEMDAQALKMNLVVPKTQMIGDGASQVSDVTAVSLPDYIKLDYTQDLRPEQRLAASGGASVFRATLLQPDAIQRNGGEVAVLKEFNEWPVLSDEDNRDRFRQEVAVMWALSFHPNVVKLVGYTESPNTIVTKLYPTDLFRYLHMQDDHNQLQSHLLLHMSSGIMAGLAAVHSIKVAHRDISAPNILLAEPKAGAVFPDPIISDFGISRALENNARFESVNGYSPRYAAPEVINRVQIKSAASSLEEDQAADMYSVGVVLWEVLARRVPWDGYANSDIEDAVRTGQRVTELDIDGTDKTVELVSSIIDSLLDRNPTNRPSATATNRKFARYIRSLVETEDD